MHGKRETARDERCAHARALHIRGRERKKPARARAREVNRADLRACCICIIHASERPVDLFGSSYGKEREREREAYMVIEVERRTFDSEGRRGDL